MKACGICNETIAQDRRAFYIPNDKFDAIQCALSNAITLGERIESPSPKIAELIMANRLELEHALVAYGEKK